MHDVDEELREIKREIIESRGLVIKTNNLTNALSADIKSIAKRQQAYEGRLSWNSATAYVVFVIVVFVALKFMVDARAFHVRAWEIHFDLMYPLTANYLGFYGLCKELGIAAADIPKFLQGYETQPMKSDRLMWQLANNARGTAVHKLIADAGPPGAYQALTKVLGPQPPLAEKLPPRNGRGAPPAAPAQPAQR